MDKEVTVIMNIPPEMRTQIISYAKKARKGFLQEELAEELNISHHALSKYLHLLQKEGVLSSTPIGIARVWALVADPIDSISEGNTFSEQLLLAAVKHPCAPLAIVDSDGTIRECSEQFERLGAKQGTNISKVIADKGFTEWFDKTLREGLDATITVTLDNRPVEIHLVCVKNPATGHSGIMCMESTTHTGYRNSIAEAA